MTTKKRCYPDFVAPAYRGDTKATQVRAQAPGDQPQHTGHKAWAGLVTVLEEYLFRSATIEDAALRAITPAQLADLWAFIQHVVKEVEIVETNERSPLYGKRLTAENLQMYSVCTYFVEPLTEPFKCSFVELVSRAEAQPPRWFVSHAWSTPFAQTISMLNFHRQSRDLPPSTPYWVCTFANNQHDLGQLLGRTRAFDI